MSQISNVTAVAAAVSKALPRVPKAGGLCARVWDLCAEAAQKGQPITSKQYVALAQQHGLNLNNVKIEASCYNRYVRGGGVYPAAGAATQQNMRDTVLSNMLAARPAPVLAAETPVTPEVPQVETPEPAPVAPVAPAQQSRKHGKGNKH